MGKMHDTQHFSFNKFLMKKHGPMLKPLGHMLSYICCEVYSINMYHKLMSKKIIIIIVMQFVINENVIYNYYNYNNKKLYYSKLHISD